MLWVVRLYAASQMTMNSIERISECEWWMKTRMVEEKSLTMVDLDLDVEEEEHAKGMEPPAYWPSRDGSVVVENLTCHYAPQVGHNGAGGVVECMLNGYCSLIPCFVVSPLPLIPRKRLVFAVGQEVARAVGHHGFCRRG